MEGCNFAAMILLQLACLQLSDVALLISLVKLKPSYFITDASAMLDMWLYSNPQGITAI